MCAVSKRSASGYEKSYQKSTGISIKLFAKSKYSLYLCTQKERNNPLILKEMRTIYNALVKELGYEEGKSIFEWYCKTYDVTIVDEAPASVRREVLGF